MMTSVSSLFVDTNVLIFATNPASPWHQIALDNLQEARQSGVELVISPQIIREYLVAATRTVPGQNLPLATILGNVQTFQSEFRLVADNTLVSTQLVKLIAEVSVAGKQIHDANIVATMQVFGIHHLLTHNVSDFARFTHLVTVLSLPTRP